MRKGAGDNTVGGGGGNVVLIDDRAGSRDLIKFPPLNTQGELCRLDSADALICGNGEDGTTVLVGVEVKSLSDLISSADTGRLQSTQIPTMLSTYNVSWLLHYGVYRSGPGGSLQVPRRARGGGGWGTFTIGKRPAPYGYVESLLLTLTATGIHVKRVASIEEAAAWIGVLARWWGKPWDKHRGMRTMDHSGQVALMPQMDSAMKQRVKFAETLPGIRFERAVEAAKHFTSVRQMANASAEEWQKVPKIGKIIAQSVVEAVS